MSLYLGDTPIAVNSSSRNIGEIIQSTIPLTDAGLHLLDGALISGSGSYADFVTYIAGLVSNYPDLFETEANWQSSVSTYGVCSKFVYDSVNNTVRLPKYSDKIWSGGGIANAKGNGMTLGFTNGTENFSVAGFYGTRGSQDTTKFGANVGTTGYTANATIIAGIGVTTDPTKSGIITDFSTLTTALDGYWYIVVATSTKTSIEVDIDEIATDLNGKADIDLTNCTKPHITETYVNGSSWYRVYSDGWCEQGGIINVNYAQQTVDVILLKQYANVDYSVLLTAGGYAANGAVNESWQNKTTSQFTIYGDYTAGTALNIPTTWQACGYIS